MSRRTKTIGCIALSAVPVLIVAAITAALVSGVNLAAPARLAAQFPLRILADEAETMAECMDCHEADKFHSCQSCHDDHGSAELAMVPFDDLLLLQGDVPEPGYIAANAILPYRDRPGTHVALLDFLSEQGAADFETVTLASRDEGWVAFDRSQLTSDALLLPHVDGLRFAAESLHISTWLKGVWRIVVVGPERPLRIDGQHTSIGRLLLGPTRQVTIEETDVMLKSDVDGQVRKARTASRIEGAAVEDVVARPNFSVLRVRDGAGRETVLTAEEARGALLGQVRGQVTLILPGRNRSQWIAGVVEIVTE